MDNIIKRIPYKSPYEYGKNELNTFGDKTKPAIVKRQIASVKLESKNFFAILYMR